jgi:AcrR family transcriptional regulator
MTPRRSDMRERILRVASELFAAQGYERTTIADIQAALGLAPGSGALYRHFPSKEAVLQAIMERFIAQGADARAMLDRIDAPAAEALPILAHGALDTLARERDEIRIAWRELPNFPELRARVLRDVMQVTFTDVAAWLRDRVARGELREHDPEAMAAVIVGSLVEFRIFEALWGTHEIDVSDERFLAAWTDLVVRGLRP